MPFFAYKAKSATGENIKGKVEAQNQTQAASILREKSLLVVSLVPVSEESFTFFHDFLFGIKQDEIVNFTRQLSTMITAGMSLIGALDILRQDSKPEMGKVITELIEEIEGGGTLAKAIEKQGKIFPLVYAQLVHAGETAGVLEEVLARLADTLEKQKEFRSKTKGALIYPTIVLLTMLGVGMLMIIFVIPKLTLMYRDLNVQLPLSTLILIGLSSFMTKFWWVVLLAGVGAVAGFRAFVKTTWGRLMFDSFLLRIPVMGDLRKKVILTEFCRTLGLLLGSGVSLLQAIEIVGKSTDNVVYRDVIEEAGKQVEKGIPISRTIIKHKIFPPLLGQMMIVGEETGKLHEVLMKLSSYFDAESEQAVKNLTAAFEPLIMIVLGLGVGALVMAILMPIYNLTSSF